MRPRILSVAAALALGALAAPLPAQQTTAPLDASLLSAYRWRNIGPDRGGRSIAATGVRGRPDEAYFGATGGGLWKTTDAGENWLPVTDFQITSASVGAVAVSETNPDLVFIGTGETCIRGNILPGDGVYRSRDAGKTWEHVGFRDSHGISKIRVHPTNPQVVFVASFGKYSAPSEERGVFKSTDGGTTWRRVLFRDANTGAIDISIDRNNPQVMYAAMWQAYRKEYQMSSGGPGSGLFKSTDGGDTWTEITRRPGLPQQGVVGRIGVSVSGADSDRVYALVEHENGGLFASDDAGASWRMVNDDRSIRQRAFYYTHVHADPRQADVVYLQNVDFYRSTDGGKTLAQIGEGTHGDFHDLWIDPDRPDHLVVANDGGGAVSMNTGTRWTEQDFGTPQFYHVVATAHTPYHVCGSQQDNSTLCVPYNWNADEWAEADSTQVDPTSGGMEYAYRAGGGEPGYIAPDPKNPDLFFSGTNNGAYLDRFDRRSGTSREVNPYPWFYSGEPAVDIKERWQWTFPIVFSPVDPNRLYTSSQRLWTTTDGGENWTALSGDLTRHDPSTLGRTGGPITGDMNGPEVYATIFAVAPGKTDVNIIWTGSDDGLIHVTRDGGATWTNVTPAGMPEFGRVSLIDASAHDPAVAYAAVKRPLLDDFAPYIFRTRDFGRSWTKVTDGIRADAYVHAVREDPTRPGLLYAGTAHGVYVSYDDGARWQPLNPGLPDLPIVSMIVRDNELVVSAHGRGFWVLDNLAPLRQAGMGQPMAAARLYTPARAVRSGAPAMLSWWLRESAPDARIEILDARGQVVRSWTPPRDTAETGGAAERGRGPQMTNTAGLNTLGWDLRTEPFSSFPGMILWGARTRAPAVVPGQYTVRLTAHGQTQTAPLAVQGNPWVQGVSDADLTAQFEFSSKVRDRVTDANDAVIAIRAVRSQLEERTKERDDARLRAAADRLRTNLATVEEKIYQVRNRSGQDPLNFPIKVNNRLATLLSMAERGDGRPVNNMNDIYDILDRELRGYEAELDRVWSTDLAAVNAELTRLGAAPISRQ